MLISENVTLISSSPTPPPQNAIPTSHTDPSIPLDERLAIYDHAVNQNNSTEDVVKIGEMIQKEIYNLTTPNTTASVTTYNHSGNWKTSLLYNLAITVSHLFPQPKLPAKIIKPIHKKHTGSHLSTKTKTTQTHNEVTISPTPKHKTAPLSHKRKRRGLEEEKALHYDLTPENIVEKMHLTEEQQQQCQKHIKKIQSIILRYNRLEQKNSREGQILLTRQANIWSAIQKTAQIPKEQQQHTVLNTIKTEYASHKVEVEKHFHGIWIAGAPPEGVNPYIKLFLDVHKDFDFYLWVDSQAYGAAKFTSIMKQISFDDAVKQLKQVIPTPQQAFIQKYEEVKEKYGSEQEPTQKEKYREHLHELYQEYTKLNTEIQNKFDAIFLKNMVNFQDSFFNWCILNGIDTISDQNRIQYLKEQLHLPAEEATQYETTIQNNKKKIEDLVKDINKQLGSERIFIKDIQDLHHMKEGENRFNYDTEMFLRWNYPAASDQLRMYIMQEHGGIYTDLDMMPPYSTEALKTIQEQGGERFFEETQNRRAISDIVLKIASGQEITPEIIGKDIDISSLTEEDKKKLPTLIESLKKLHTKDTRALFTTLQTQVIRDHMPILKRYHKLSNGQWNVRGLNGFMYAHKDSAVVEKVIQGQQQAYEEVRRLRQTLLSGEFFQSLDDLQKLNHMDMVGGFLVKDYLAGSLFHDFRQDMVIQNALSTLGISGPDLITKKMVEYFQGLGTIGRDYLRANGKKLNDKAYIGTFNEIKKEGKKTFDWMHPLTVGANDVTPADESTWCVSRKKCAAELLFSDPSKMRTESPKKIERTKIRSKEEFVKLWSEESKKKLPSGLLDRFNHLIESSDVDVALLSSWDREAHLFMSQIQSDPQARASLFSLQLQVANLIQNTRLPVSNQIHFFLDTHKNLDPNIEQAIRLYLKSHSQTQIFFWYSEMGDLSLFFKEILSASTRDQKISTLLGTGASLSEEDKAILKEYSDLESKHHMDLLTIEEQDKYLELTVKIAENQDLSAKVKTIESSLKKGHFITHLETTMPRWLELSSDNRKKKLLSVIETMEGDGKESKEDQKQRRQRYEELYDQAYEKRITAPKEKLKKILETFKDTQRVRVENLDVHLKDNPLFTRMHLDGYAFKDIGEVYKLMAASQGLSGIFSSNILYPTPSRHLVESLASFLKDYREVEHLLPIVYDYLAQPELLQEGSLPEEVRKTLDTSPTSDLLIPPVDASVSVLGTQYGVENGVESERVFTNIIPGILNPSIHVTMYYVEALYTLHKHIHNGSLTAENAKQILTHSGALCFAKEEHIQELVKHAQTKDNLSLTEVHRILTKQKTLAQATSPLLSRLLPGVNPILQKNVHFALPSSTSMQSSPALYPYDYRGVGASKDLLSLPSEVPTLPSIVEQAKYTLFSWHEFFNEHISLWDGLASRLGSRKTETHPQSFLYEIEGRCMGLSILYMSATDVVSYAHLVDNLMTASALFRTQEIKHLPLTQSDDTFLKKTRSLVDWLQYRGNKELSTTGILTPHNWDIDKLTSIFQKYTDLSSLLITTPTHSMVLQVMDENYRVTDPNFGHVDFSSVESALTFIEYSVQLSDTIRNRYGITNTRPIEEQIKVYVPETQAARNSWAPPSEAGLITHHHLTSLDRTTLRGGLSLRGFKTTWKTLYSIGATVEGRRVDENTPQSHLERLQLNGDVLADFLSYNVPTKEEARLISVLLSTNGLMPGTQQISRAALSDTTDDLASLLFGIKTRAEQTRDMLRALLQDIESALKRNHLSNKENLSIQNIEITNHDHIEVTYADTHTHHKISVHSHGLTGLFKEFTHSANTIASTGVLDLELGMSIVSLTQYLRLVKEGRGKDSSAIFNAILDVKALSEQTVGAIIQGVGGKFISHSGIEGFRLETAIAQQLKKTASQIGGTTGRALGQAAAVLELPVLEAAAGIWGLYDSIDHLLHATSHSDKMAARVQVAFDVASLALIGVAIAAPMAMLAAGPVAAIGMGASSIAYNVALKEERHMEWLKIKDFLVQGAKHIVTALPDRGVLDFSNNQVLGNIYLDLRTNPPTLTGDPSYNANIWIGHKPHWSDARIRDSLGYAYRITPYYALAQGHANSRWPNHIPSIPPGTYTQVILGYGITYKSVTEVIYLSNQIVWREAILEPNSRHYRSPLSPEKKSCTVVGGSHPLTVILTRLLDEDSEERVQLASSYKDFKIQVRGGTGGITVQIGGAGEYDIVGQEGTENTISFRAIPPPFSVFFNASLHEQNVPLTRPNNTQLNILKIKQRGLNTIIGSTGGYDTLVGSHNTKFYPSIGGGVIYSGTGDNLYVVPKAIEGNLTLILHPNSTQHTLQLEVLCSELHADSGLNLLYTQGNENTGIWIRNTQANSSLEQWEKKLTARLGDGITLTATQVNTSGINTTLSWGVQTCDQDLWSTKHPKESSFPEKIIDFLKSLFWKFTPVTTLIQHNCQTSYIDSEGLFIYQPQPHSELHLQCQDTYTTLVKGSPGSSYVLTTCDTKTKNITIQLAEDTTLPQILDITGLSPVMVVGKILNTTMPSIDLTISSYTHTVPITLSWDPSNTTLETQIYVAPHHHPKLGEWYRLLTQNPKVPHILYQSTMLIPERVEEIRRLNNTAFLMLGELRKNEEHILEVENKGATHLKILGKLWSGHIKGARIHRKWMTFPKYRHLQDFGITVPKHTHKYLAFEGKDNVLFYSVLESRPLDARTKPRTTFPRSTWREYDEIRVFGTALTLEDFNRYRIASETPHLSRLLLYTQGRVKIQDRDFILKFFYSREERGIGSIQIVFKDFFKPEIEGLLEATMEREVKPLMANAPTLFVDPAYWNCLELILGKESFDLATIIQEFSSGLHILPLKESADHQLAFPERYQPHIPTVLTHTLSLDTQHRPETILKIIDKTMAEYRLPAHTHLEGSYYLDPLTGDLYITRILENDIQAFVLRLTSFRTQWGEFKNIVISAPHKRSNRLSITALTFVGPELRHLEIDSPEEQSPFQEEAIISRSSLVFPNNDQVMHYDPRVERQFFSLLEYMLWNLQDRVRGSERARHYDNYLLEAAMHISDQTSRKWLIPEDMLGYATGYYRAKSPYWVRYKMRVGTRLKMPKGSIDVSLITTQNALFSRTADSQYTIYFAFLGLHHHVTSSQKPGDMRLHLDKEVELIVRKIDESEYHQKRIYVVAEMSSKETRHIKNQQPAIVIPNGERIQHRHWHYKL